MIEAFQKKTTWILSNRKSPKSLDFQRTTKMFQNHQMCFPGWRLALYIVLAWSIRTVGNTSFLRKKMKHKISIRDLIRNTYPKGNRSPEQNFITVKIHTYYFCCVLIYVSRTLKFQKTWTITDRVQTSPMFLSSNAFEKCPWNVMEINVWKIFKGFINKLN